MSVAESEVTVNLTKATVLVVEGSQHSLDLTCQILKGFGVMSILRTTNMAEAEQLVRGKTVDLLVIDPSVSGGSGYDFVRELRRSKSSNCDLPIVLTGGHLRHADVTRARDTGANFVVKKPLSAAVLLQRILWVTRDPRPFVDLDDYTGPDRRFKYEGPPSGGDGRRSSDLKAPIGAPAEPNLSQDELNSLIKPQRVTL